MKLFEYECDACGKKEDRLVNNDTRDNQVCGCGEPLRRCISAVKGWVKSKERTDMQLKRRSMNHTRKMMESRQDPRENETFRNTNQEWHNKTRTKVTKKGMVEEHKNDWKKWKADNEKLGLDDSGTPTVMGRPSLPSEKGK